MNAQHKDRNGKRFMLTNIGPLTSSSSVLAQFRKTLSDVPPQPATRPGSGATLPGGVAGSAVALRDGARAAGDILEHLNRLAGLARQSDSLVDPSTHLGTSRQQIQALARKALNDINHSVLRAGEGHGNLISASSGSVRLRLTEYGGSTVLNPVGLDAYNLGLDNLDLTTQSGAEAAHDQIAQAIGIVTLRRDQLAGLGRGVSYSGGITETLMRSVRDLNASGSGSGQTAGKGSLVNIFG